MMMNFLRKAYLVLGAMLILTYLQAQELYVFSEPASNMPAHSLSAKLSAKLIRSAHNRTEGRYIPEIMFGLNKNWMVHGALSFSNMYSEKLKWESLKGFAKYRFYSHDEVHKHLRMAAFGEVAYSRNALVYDELSFDGDQSGAQAGLIVTQLTGKLAISTTLSYLHVLTAKPKFAIDPLPFNAINYSASAGYLVLPFNYTSFKQTNLNIYTELLGQRSIDLKKYAVDLAPAIQLIFNSNAKLNIGYRFQLGGNMNRMATESWHISFERTFLNALKQ